MEQFKSDSKQLTFQENLYHHYRQYVQFLNDLVITQPYTPMLIIFPNFVMIMEVATHLSHTETDTESNVEMGKFYHNISYLGVSQALIQIFDNSPMSAYIFLALMVLLLLSPFLTIIQIFLTTALETRYKKQIGYFRSRYQSSIIHKLVRFFIYFFQYIFMPIFSSIGIKMIIPDQGFGNGIQTTLGTTILILVPLVYLISQYHILQLADLNERVDKQLLILTRIKFPNNLIDGALIYIYFLTINMLESNLPFIVSIIIYTARLFVTGYFQSYPKSIIKQQYFTQICSLIILIGLFITFQIRQVYITLICIFTLLIFIFSIKDKLTFTCQSEYQSVNNQQTTIEDLKKQLVKYGTFTHVFRELIFHSRKNYTHRKKLLIQILKVKCYELQSKSRGGAQMINTQDLIKFQSLFQTFIGNMLLIGDGSISILRLLQNKEPKREIFAYQVKKLVDKINQNKQIISRMRYINDISLEGINLMKIMFHQFYNDTQFIKELEQISRSHINSLAQKQVKMRLFNKKTTAIFINVLEQPGKITRVSKNLPAVLGHMPSDLIGKSINQIIPFTIQPYHDQILIKFVEKYSKKTMRSDPSIQFFAFNKDFYLQQCMIRYNFVMSYFSSFQLSGVMRKIEEEDKNIIIMNNDGILEGWTEQIANIFNFNQFQMGECLKFNILSLFPTLIKYCQVGGACIKTIFFRSGKVKQKALQINQFRNLSGRALNEKQLSTFKYLLQSEQLVQAYIGDIQFQNIQFCNGKAKLKKILIKSYERVQNFNQIQQIIIKRLNGQQIQSQKELQEANDNDKSISRQISVMELSMNEQTNFLSKFIDTNFSLSFDQPNLLNKQDIRLQSQVPKSQLSIELTDKKYLQQDNFLDDQVNEGIIQQGSDSLIQNSFSPKIQTQTNFIPLLILIAVCFIAIITWDQMILSYTQNQMRQQCQNAINRNRALMIYSKSTFNPNATYIRQFDSGNLMEVSSFLGHQYFDYKTYLGDVIKENKYYMFNIQIPAILDRILMAPNQTRKKEYQKEILYNFNAIMEAWIERFAQSQALWLNTIEKVRTDFIIRLVFIGIGSIAFSLFLLNIYFQYQKQKRMTQAFFKFQKTDLDMKMASIRKVIKNVQIKAVQWHFQKQFYEFIKKKQITNLQFEMQTTPYETKIKFQISQEAQQKLAKKKLYNVLVFIVVFLLTQVLFIILYSVLNLQQIKNFQTIPKDLNKACKLIVLPNLMLANIFYSVPPQMISSYKNIQVQVLQRPLQNVPGLFGLLEEAPCSDCEFLYPLLTTNFRSFYSTFQQMITQKTLNKDQNITQLFYAVDVVVNRISASLVIKDLLFLPATVFLYLFSLAVFFLSIYLNIKKMIEENQKLEVFLKYFDEEILIKNKHMSGLFNKNN